MHICEDIVFDRHLAAMIGFADLGKINEHLLHFERSTYMQWSQVKAPQPAKTMFVFMARGLLNSLQFTCAQFPSTDLSGQLLYVQTVLGGYHEN